MIWKWVGAILVIAGCGGFGFTLARRSRREEACLSQVIHLLDYMECELRCRMTPLPLLCENLAQQGRGCVPRVFMALARQLEACDLPDADSCMKAVLEEAADLPASAAEALAELGRSLGHFDMDGQVRQIEAVRIRCEQAHAALMENRDVRLRSYQTLGLCAGAALAILFV